MDRASMPLELQSRQPANSTGWTRGDVQADQPGARRNQRQHATLDVFSPVNENGSFEFDRVLKSGKVWRRSKNKHSFKASWKPCYMVLRPNLLSVYKDEDEAKLQMSTAVCDLSAVALVKTPKSKRPDVFGIFSPAKNYQFQAVSAEDADSWISLIRSETPATHADADKNTNNQGPGPGITDNCIVEESGYDTSEYEGHTSSNARALRAIPINPAHTHAGVPRRQNYGANEITSCPELSDTGGQPSSFQSMGSFHTTCRSPVSPSPMTDSRPGLRRDASQHSDLGSTHVESERVIFQGYLQCLKAVKGVKKWKRYWVVLRRHNLHFYKNSQEYSAVLIIPMDQVISVAEMDPISHSKLFCFQVIAEDKAHQFSAPDEETLDKWLGSLTSVLIKLHGGVQNPVPGALGNK